MGKSYSDFREIDEICFFSRALFFALFFTIFAISHPAFPNKGFPQKLRIV
jgi:hypothetical protein